jgi:hypothetical protein
VEGHPLTATQLMSIICMLISGVVIATGDFIGLVLGLVLFLTGIVGLWCDP